MRRRNNSCLLGGSAASSSFMLVVGQLALLLSNGDHLASAQPLKLAGGGYTATTNPLNEANLALDAAAIKESTDLATKKQIYKDGGGSSPGKSLAKLSLDATPLMKDDDMFNVFRYAFNYIGNVKEHEDLNHFDDEDVGVYANTIVEDLFDLNTENIETDAALVTSVWMTVVHYLYEAMNECKATATSAGSDSPSGEAALDKAAAYWIGIGQEFGENEGGHMLYSLTEKAGLRFGQDNIEAEVNTNIIGLLNQIKTDIIQPGACKQPDGYLQFRFIVDKIIAQMTVPLVQNLYHYSSEKNEKFLELYALALTPQIAACSTAEFDWFLEELVMKDLNQQDFPEVVSRLQALYPCLGITCQDVGSYKNGAIPQCSDSAVVTDIAGYTPERDVSEILKLDRDVLRIKILMGWEAYDAAADIYVNGRNSKQDGTLLSLQSIATSSERSVVPESDWFKTYYNDDDNYADTMIQDAFKGSASTNFPGASPEQLQGVVFRLLQTLVTPMYSLQEMHKAINLCGSDSNAAEDAWDRGAALYVGSGEGTEAGGTGSGVLLHGLANEICDKFGTCDDDGNAQANGDMIDFFQRGKESLSDGSCAALPNPTLPARLIGDMRLAMIQGTLHFAAVNDKLGANSREGSIGEGFGASRSILPYLNQVNAFDSRSVDKNMAYPSGGGKPVPDGYVEVFGSIANALKTMDVDCGDVGVYIDVVANGNMCALANGGAVPVPPTQSGPTSPVSRPTARPPTSVPVQAPTRPATQPEGGQVDYTFTTDGKEAGLISNDVKEIASSSVANAKTLYNNGKSSTTSLQSLSTDASSRYGQDRLYNIFRFAFRDEPVFVDGGTGSLADSSYANTVISKALEIAEDTELAAVASVALNTWMEIIHQLEQAVLSCTDSSIDSALAMDTAVGYYVGAGQIKGSSDGNLMYAMAEEAADRFGENPGEAPSNTLIMSYFRDAKVLADSCSSGAPVQLRRAVDKIIAQMNVPLIRQLVYYMNAATADDESELENFIELYALATVPQVAGCNPGAFAYLRDELIDYEWDSNDLGDILAKLRDSLSCFGLTCSDIGILQDSVATQQLCGGGVTTSTSLAGYEPSTDVSRIASIDRDILQINIMLQMGAPQQARAIYVGGQNSIIERNDAYTTLQDLATDDDRIVPGNTQFDIYSSYYSNPYYADSVIMDAFDKKGDFGGLSNSHIAQFVVGALREMVTYMYGIRELYTAIDECESDSSDHGSASWDRAAAVLIGSIDGAKQISDYPSGGKLMYSLGNEVCDNFGKCSDSNVGASSSKLVEYLTGGKLFLSDSECEGASDLVDAGITSSLQVSLIQGSINATAQLSKAGLSDGIAGAAHALMYAVAPLVDASNPSSATTIENNMKLNGGAASVDSVIDAFRDAIAGMSADCTEVGVFRDTATGVCPPDAVAADTPVSLANGLYTTSTYVQDRALLALDLRDMEKALKDGNSEVARGIYEGGLNSDIYDKNGKKVGTRSLSSFSTSAPLVMSQEPTYILFKYALDGIDNGLYLGGPTGEYADSIVQKAFESQDNTLLPVEAARALNLWMYVVHELYQAVDNCRRKLLKDDDGVHSIDEVAAYYIGDSQQTGSAEEGHSLYALAEEIGQKFGQDGTGQSTVNVKIISLLNDAKNEISYPGACTTNNDSYKRLRSIAHKIISQMTVPLIQNLIYNLAENDRERVQLYAQAFVPLTAACNPGNFEFLRDKLMVEQYNVVDVDNIIRVIENTYQCLGLSCDDIGVFNDYGGDCVGTPELNPLAGYIPQTDVRKIAALDLDIQAIQIFMKERAYDAVRDYYTLGRHASITTRIGDEVFSLKDLATTSTRQIVPSFEYFKNYFGAEVDEIEDAADYADHMITTALDTDKLSLASPEQRTEIVVKTSQYMVVYMAALEAMYEAIDDCRSNDSQRKANAANEWDRAAAYLIGSLEGTESGGTDRGLMMYSLANKRCEQFNRCENDGTAELNGLLIDLLYAGRGETMGSNCDALQKTTTEIEQLLQVPLIQGTLRYAIANEKLMFYDKSKGLAEGYVFSHSVLPYVAEVDGDAASVIKRNMDFQFDYEPVRDGARKVFQAFAGAIPKMGVDCETVGTVDGLGGVCGTSSSSLSRRTQLSITTSIVVAGITIVASLL